MADKKVGGVEFELRRDLGFFDITMIGIGAMIGAGIFVLTGYAINSAGPAAILVLLFNGVVAILTGLTYMELGSCFPEAGGGYLWVREGMPHPFGFLSGWMSWMAHTVACSLYALGFGSYLTWLFEEYGVNLFGISDIFAKLFAVLVAIALLAINYIGTGTTGKTENIFTIAKLIILFIFIGAGLVAFIHNPGAVSNFTEGFFDDFGGIAYGMGLTFIAFQGFEVIAQSGEEVENPRKNIPKAIMISLIVVIIIYIAIAFIIIITMGTNIGEKPELAIVESARTFMGPIGFIVMIVGGLISTISALNATVYSSSRVSFAMGRDGTLPKSLGRIHEKRRTPSNAIMLTGVIMIIMAVALPIEDVAASAGIMFLLLFSFANISLITLRRKMPYLQRGFVVPLVPVIPVIATVLNIALAIYLWVDSPVSWYIAIVWIEFGLISYYFTRGEEEIKTIDKVEKLIGVPKRETGKDYHVLVPIANPKNTELLDFAGTVAKHKDGDLILLNIARIPDNLPIQNVGYDFVKRRVATAETLSEYATTKHNLLTRARVVVSHKIRDSILDVVNKEKANITIIGWSGKPPRSRIMFGYNIDDIIQFAKSDVVVYKGPLKGDLKRILVVPGYGLHATRTAELAAYFARENSAKVVVVGLQTPDKSETEIRTEVKRISEICRNIGAQTEENVIQTRRPVSTLTSLSNDFDILLMGASEKWKLLRFAFGPMQDSLAGKVKIPLMMIRAYEKEEKMLSTSKLGDEDERAVLKPVKKVERPTPVPIPFAKPVADEEVEEDVDETTEPGEAEPIDDDEQASIDEDGEKRVESSGSDPSRVGKDDILGEDALLKEDSITDISEKGSDNLKLDKTKSELSTSEDKDIIDNEPSESETEVPKVGEKVEPSIPEELMDEGHEDDIDEGFDEQASREETSEVADKEQSIVIHTKINGSDDSEEYMSEQDVELKYHINENSVKKQRGGRNG